MAVEVYKPKVICPLRTEQLIDIIMSFVDLYNSSAKIELYSYQRIFMRRIIESILLREGSVLTGLFSRQAGKSEAISSLAGALCIFIPTLARAFPDDERLSQYVGGFWIGIFAPRLQQSGIIYGRIRERAEKEESLEIYRDPDINIALSQSRGDQVSWSNGSFVSSQTASEQSNVEGKTYHVVILDEAQLISRDKVRKEILPMLAAVNGTCVSIGTASNYKGGYHDSITFNIQKEKKGGKRNHFEFPYEIVIAEKRKQYEKTGNPFHLNYEAWVVGELERLGGDIDNPEFKMNFRLLWQEAILTAIDRDALHSAAETRLEMGEIRRDRRRVAGLDFGKVNDSTVLTINEIGDIVEYNIKPMLRPGDEPAEYREKVFVGWHEIFGRWEDQKQQIVELCDLYDIDVLCADASNAGDPIVESLADLMPSVTVVAITFNHVVNDKLYKKYIQEIESGRQKYAAGPETRERHEYKTFVRQHEKLEKYYVGQYLSCAAPSGEHDDFADSGSLATWAADVEPEGSAEVGVEDNIFYESRGKNRGNGVSRAERYR